MFSRIGTPASRGMPGTQRRTRGRVPHSRQGLSTPLTVAAPERARVFCLFFRGAAPAAFGRWTRRAFLVSGLARWAFAEQKGALLPSAWHPYSDPATEFEVLRLTDPAHSCWLPAYYNRTLARRGGFLLY